MRKNDWGGSNHDEDTERLLALLYREISANGFIAETFGEAKVNTTAYGGIRAKMVDKVFDINVSVKEGD